MEMLIGFYPYNEEFDAGDITVKPLPDNELEANVRRIFDQPCHDGNWYYPPICTVNARPTNIYNGIARQPRTHEYLPRYELEPTHIFEHKLGVDEQHMRFLISCFGVFVGMRIVPVPEGHFYRTPIVRSTFGDVMTNRKEVQYCLKKADAFWRNNQANDAPKVLKAAIHAYQSALSYEHQHEKFIFLYMALDSLIKTYRLSDPSFPPPANHGAYAEALLDYIGAPKPPWAVRGTGKASDLSIARNNLFHESRINGEPFGYELLADNKIPLELEGLLTRAFFHVLGVKALYISGSLETLQQRFLEVPASELV